MKHLFSRIEIQLLMNATAHAFGEKSRRVWTLPHTTALAVYADCTCLWMHQSNKDVKTLQSDMYRQARRLGNLIRRLTFYLNNRGHTRLIFALYRGIGITMCGQLPGTVHVTSCYFSNCYTPWMCKLISAMDDGIVSGIMGGGTLSFTQRITEGHPYCCACLARSEKDEQ